MLESSPYFSCKPSTQVLCFNVYFKYGILTQEITLLTELQSE